MTSFLVRFFVFPRLSVAVMLICSVYFYDVFGLRLMPADLSSIVWLSLIWTIFWFMDTVVATIIKFFTIPLRFLTLWLSNLVVNAWVLYALQFLLHTQINVWYDLILGTFIQTVFVALFISFGTTFLRRLLSLFIK